MIYLYIEHSYEVGALRVVFDEADHSGVLQAPHGGAMRQSHEQLCHCSGHRLNTQTDMADIIKSSSELIERILLQVACKFAVL